MKISVITVTLNDAATIDGTIRSVAEQIYSDVEHIIIDGMSADGTDRIVEEWRERRPGHIRVVREPDSGIYNAINKGIALATGDVVGLLHGNDRLSSPDVLERVARCLDETRAAYLYGDLHYTRPRSDKVVRRYSSRRFDPSLLRVGIAPPHPTLYMRRPLFDTIGTYKEDYLIAADFDMFVRLMLTHQIPGTYLPCDMVTMTTGGLSTRLYHRLVTNNAEKMRALRENHVKASPFSILKRYLYIRKQYM
ncbi:MAG: glycosyltransferase [Pseudoflavonifractor sp.]|nr:glycosyltransferase [Pseudoflavonifractor sp.]